MFGFLQGRGPAWSAALRRLFLNTEGLHQLAPELQAEICVESDRPEWSFLKGEQLRAGATAAAAGGAGNRSVIILRNPTNSGVIIVVERVFCAAVVAAQPTLLINQAQVAGASDIGATTRDGRQQGLTLTGRFLTKNSAAVPAGSNIWQGSGSGAQLDEPIILPPGWELYLCPNTDNLAINGGYIWRERVFTEQELAG